MRFDFFRLSVVLLCLSVSSGCVIHIGGDGWDWDGGHSIRGNGVAAMEIRETAPFERIEVADSVDLIVHVGHELRVDVHGDENLLPYMRTNTSGDTLHISLEHGNYRSQRDLRVEVYVPHLSGVAIEGHSDATIEGVDAESFRASIRGSGEMRVSGRATELEASISGSGDMHLYGLQASTATVRISGSGDVRASVSDEISVNVSGSGDVMLRGTPRVSANMSGSGSFKTVTE